MIGRLTGISHAVILSEGWKRRFIALFAGAIGALTQAPLGLVPAFLFSFPLAVWLLDGTQADGGRFSRAGLLAAARDGWWFGFGYFVAGLWWIGAAFLVETDEFAWALPLGVLGLPAILAPFIALGFVVARLFWSAGAGRIFALALGLGAGEWLRHFLFTGFPWNTFGQGLGSSLLLAQSASLIGADGLSLLAVIVFAMPATLADKTGASARFRPTLLALAALLAVGIYGFLRLELNGGFNPGFRAAEMVPGVKIRMVQPNISQRDKLLQRDSLATLAKLLALSDRATGPQATGLTDVTHVIWPESPFPTILTRDSRTMAEIARVLPAKTILLTGAVRMEESAGQKRDYYNTLHVFGAGGRVIQSYDKQHLVPFGEYLPLEKLLTSIGLRRFVQAPGEFATGTGRPLLQVPGLPPILPLICYEAIFPHEIAADEPGAGALLNITNDAWFGETFGPHQHFAQARMRAIEFGLPLIRVANTGISAVADPYGRVLSAIGVGIEGISDISLPKGLGPTFYGTHGLAVRSLALLFLAVAAIFLGRRKSRSGQTGTA